MTVMNFNTANQTYRQLMGNGLIYSVPRFQRDYSWTDQEWEDLWADILDLLTPDGEDAHYMGYLVLQSKDSKNFDIIDGQQRLTTLSILALSVLAHLELLAEKNVDADNNRLRQEQLRNSFIGYLDPVSLVPRSKLNLNRNNNSFFQNHLVPLQKLPQRGLKATEHLMRKAFEWFNDRIKQEYGDRNDGATIAGILDSLADKLFFTVITVTDELNAYKVFETLNARGVRLSSTDLLKNWLFSVVHHENSDEYELDSLDERWEILVSKLGSESFPDFLRTHWNSRNRFVRHADLFKTMRANVLHRKHVFELIRSMESDADFYVALSSHEDQLWKPTERKYIEELRMFNVRQLYPLLMAAWRSCERQDFTDVLRACTIISFRYNVIGNLPTHEQERSYTSVAEQISKGKLKSFYDILVAMRSIYPDDEAFSNAFGDKQLKTTQSRNKRIVRYILFKLEAFFSGTEYDFDSDRYNIEHILPEHPENNWEQFSDRDYEQSVYRLGNMTLMNTAANRDAGNASYEEKRPRYAESEMMLTKKIAEENQNWTIERIGNRQRWMAKQAKTIWRISQLD